MTPNKEFQNWVNESPLFPEGYFYQFKGLIKNDTTFSYEINNPELMLGFLMGLGIEIEDAWYKGQENSCGLFEVIVSSSLAIRTKTNENKELLKRYGFAEVGKPFADCPYNVIHYIFNWQ